MVTRIVRGDGDTVKHDSYWLPLRLVRVQLRHDLLGEVGRPTNGHSSQENRGHICLSDLHQVDTPEIQPIFSPGRKAMPGGHGLSVHRVETRQPRCLTG